MSCFKSKCCGKECSLDLCKGTIDEAFGLPKKTIRAILALIVICSAMALTSTLLIFLCIHEEWDISIGLVGAVLSIGTGILGYYFGFRSASLQNDIEHNRIEPNRIESNTSENEED